MKVQSAIHEDDAAPPKARWGWAIAGLLCGATSFALELKLRFVVMSPGFFYVPLSPLGNGPMQTAILIVGFFAFFFLAIALIAKAFYVSGKHGGAGKWFAMIALVAALLPMLLPFYHFICGVLYWNFGIDIL